MEYNTKLNILTDKLYTLHIPESVEKKIRYHINRFPHTEWSGYLFYTIKGSFETNDIEFTAKDFVVLDIGTGGSTSFADNAKVCSYQIDHDLLDCYEALIHSHHSMGAFFSGTDDQALRQEGTNCNHFLSLVVDTRGTYVARVTKRVTVKQQIHQTIVQHLEYPTYEDEVVIKDEQNLPEKDFENNYTEIIAYPLNIEVEKVVMEDHSEWDKDIREAQSTGGFTREQASTSAPSTTTINGIPVKLDDEEAESKIIPIQRKYGLSTPYNPVGDEVPGQQTIPFEEFKSASGATKELSAKDLDDLIGSLYTEKDVKWWALQLVAACPFMGKNQISMLPQYAVKLPTLVKERYKEEGDYIEYMDRMVEGLFTEILTNYGLDPELEEQLSSAVAVSIMTVLSSIPHNKYIQHISDAVNAYLY